MIDFNSLVEVENVNTRINYDMRYSQKTQRFTLSQEFFNLWNLDENGFRVMKASNGQVVLKLVSNEDANVHKGRSEGQKGLTFTARTLEKLLEANQDTTYVLTEQKHNGDSYFIVEPLAETKEEVVEVVQDTPIQEEIVEQEETFVSTATTNVNFN